MNRGKRIRQLRDSIERNEQRITKLRDDPRLHSQRYPVLLFYKEILEENQVAKKARLAYLEGLHSRPL